MGLIELRAATNDDAPVVAEILDECTRHYVKRATTIDDAVQRLSEGDGLIAFLDGEAAGFGHTWRWSDEEARAFVRIRPSAKGRGVGSALLTAVEGLAPVAPLLTATCWAADDGAPRVLEACGFTPLRYFQRMRVELAHARTPTAGALRAFVPGEDDDAVFAAYSASFADQWGGFEEDEKRWWSENRDAANAGYDPALWLVAEEAGAVVGFLIARESEDEGETIGWVSLLGVVPFARGRGLGEALLTNGLALLRERGLRVAALNVDAENTSGALRLYRKAGMEPLPSFTIWGKRPRTTPRG